MTINLSLKHEHCQHRLWESVSTNPWLSTNIGASRSVWKMVHNTIFLINFKRQIFIGGYKYNISSGLRLKLIKIYNLRFVVKFLWKYYGHSIVPFYFILVEIVLIKVIIIVSLYRSDAFEFQLA